MQRNESWVSAKVKQEIDLSANVCVWFWTLKKAGDHDKCIECFVGKQILYFHKYKMDFTFYCLMIFCLFVFCNLLGSNPKRRKLNRMFVYILFRPYCQHSIHTGSAHWNWLICKRYSDINVHTEINRYFLQYSR